MKNRISLAVLCLLALAASCDKNESAAPDTIETGDVETTAFTFTISSTINDLSAKDIAYGIIGVLYGEADEIDESVFQAWKEGENVKCQKFTRVNSIGNKIYQAKIEGLKPDKSYLACMYFESEDNRREIGKPITLTTMPFAAKAVTGQATDVYYGCATVPCTLEGILPADLGGCTYGILLSRQEEPTLANATNTHAAVNDDRFEATFNKLSMDTEYHFKPYIHVTSTDSYIYGVTGSFKTRNADDMAVDMGLSVDWSELYLGAERPGGEGELYRWGETETARTDREYIFYNPVDGTFDFSELGWEINGTRYDAAKSKLGGNWRMPTQSDMKELIANCEISVYEGKTTEENLLVLKSIKNGAKISLPATRYMIWDSDAQRYVVEQPYGNVYFQSSTRTESDPANEIAEGVVCFASDFDIRYASTHNKSISIIPVITYLFALPILPVRDKE